MSTNLVPKQARKDETHSSNGGKTASLRPPQQTLKCPRCDSPNTKFCYYNNYNLTQPRHFCKTCRRYWTKGGALRNIPIGGGCRKNKKTKSCSRILDTLSPPPAMDFQLAGGLNLLHPSRNLPFMNLDPLGFTHSNQTGLGFSSFQEMGVHHYTNLDQNTSLGSSMNQDLHWKLQQKEVVLQPILFQNLEIPKPTQSSIVGDSRKDGIGSSSGHGGVGELATEWFFDNSYVSVDVNSTTGAGNGGNGNGNGNGNNWNGIQAWNHMNQYSSLP